METLQPDVVLTNGSCELKGFSPLSDNSMENLDRKFDKMLSLQLLDKSKAIAHIIQEV